MKDGGLTERHALRVVAMSASSLRYQSAPDRNIALRSSILALAHRHRRYGAGMIYLKLRQRGLVVNHKRVERLYKDAELQVRKRLHGFPRRRQRLRNHHRSLRSRVATKTQKCIKNGIVRTNIIEISKEEDNI